MTEYNNLTSSNTTKYKVILLGDSCTGKTSILTRFTYGTFDPTFQSTIGIDFLSKTMHLDDRSIRLQLWDTAGQERFRTLINSYVRDSSVAVILYDVTSKFVLMYTNKPLLFLSIYLSLFM